MKTLEECDAVYECVKNWPKELRCSSVYFTDKEINGSLISREISIEEAREYG